MKMNMDSVLRAIRAHCLECSGNSKTEVERCGITDCHLYPYRTVGSAQKAHADEHEEIEGQLTMFEEENSGTGLSKRA